MCCLIHCSRIHDGGAEFSCYYWLILIIDWLFHPFRTNWLAKWKRNAAGGSRRGSRGTSCSKYRFVGIPVFWWLISFSDHCHCCLGVYFWTCRMVRWQRWTLVFSFQWSIKHHVSGSFLRCQGVDLDNSFTKVCSNLNCEYDSWTDLAMQYDCVVCFCCWAEFELLNCEYEAVAVVIDYSAKLLTREYDFLLLIDCPGSRPHFYLFYLIIFFDSGGAAEARPRRGGSGRGDATACGRHPRPAHLCRPADDQA